MTKNNYHLNIIGQVPYPKADKKGFTIMRLFTGAKGYYDLKRWNGVGNWVLTKTSLRSKEYQWITLSKKDANSLIKGEQRTVDTDVLQVA